MELLILSHLSSEYSILGRKPAHNHHHSLTKEISWLLLAMLWFAFRPFARRLSLSPHLLCNDYENIRWRFSCKLTPFRNSLSQMTPLRPKPLERFYLPARNLSIYRRLASISWHDRLFRSLAAAFIWVDGISITAEWRFRQAIDYWFR